MINRFLLSLFIFNLYATSPSPIGYFIAVKKNDGHPLDSLNVFSPLMPPENKFYADPILFKHGDINYIFFEDYDYKKGVISYVKIEDGILSTPVQILDLPIHLSFPSIFQDGADIYMIPETFDYNAVSLFKAIDFPSKWEFVRFLVSGRRFADPMLFKHGGYYWLFTAIRGDCLCIYYAKNIGDEFQPHPINKKMVQGRNAGLVYYSSDQFIRPVMDCSLGYGKSVILKEIIQLDPLNFKEEPVAHIFPTWAPYLKGTHTFCQDQDYVVYDGRCY